MTRIEVSRNRLRVHVQGLDRLLALRSRMDIPLDHVVSVEPAGKTAASVRGLQALESRLPAAIAPTTFYQRTGGGPWGTPGTPDPERTLVIGLYDERYSTLVIEVENPDATATAIRAAVQAA
jgi:hypothetical protein